MTDTKDKPHKYHRPPHLSRDIMTAAMGLFGAKIGSSIVGNALLIKTLVVKHNDGTLHNDIAVPIAESWEKFRNLDNPEIVKLAKELRPHFADNLRTTIIAAGICAIPAAVVGWHRGDRIDHVEQLLTKPLESIHKLRISDSEFYEEYPDHPLTLERQQQAEQRAAKFKTNWREKVEATAEQADTFTAREK